MKRPRCERCELPLAACLCAALPVAPIANQWPVHILQHKQERTHALNTARIAMLGLQQCQLHAVSDAPVETTLSVAVVASLASALLIYPGTDSTDVSHLRLDDVVGRPLLLLDASWRKSRRLLLGSSWLQQLPRISVALPTPSRYRIRREPQPGYCSSLEALCHVLGTLEGDHARYAPLLAAMDLMVEQQITQMGEATYSRNYFPGSPVHEA
ncbi:MAG: tRNA-uridine aminocarboxypropyltransferase [Pseudomonadota bacterium]